LRGGLTSHPCRFAIPSWPQDAFHAQVVRRELSFLAGKLSMTAKTAFFTALGRTDQPRRETLRRELARTNVREAEGAARPTLVLASASPRRLRLLAQVGVEPDALRPASIDESARRGEMPRAYAARLARAKAEAARDQIANDKDIAGAYVLAADTAVAVGRRILMKPSNIEEAANCLQLLSGRAHRVLTSVCLITPDDRVRHKMVDTRVRFKHLSREEIEAYIASREWRGKAGGYAIQGLAGCFVQKLTGSYTSVVGLPLTEVVSMLVGEGFPIHFAWVRAAELDPT
jgi:septum formation protein